MSQNFQGEMTSCKKVMNKNVVVQLRSLSQDNHGNHGLLRMILILTVIGGLYSYQIWSFLYTLIPSYGWSLPYLYVAKVVFETRLEFLFRNFQFAIKPLRFDILCLLVKGERKEIFCMIFMLIPTINRN